MVTAKAISPTTGRRYGVERVCRVWGVARSTFYAARSAGGEEQPQRTPGRRGPKPAISDTDLLAAIRADLARSTWSGEGHRKVWARLRVLHGLRVSRKRVLRLMRENMLLSPHRAHPRPEESHDRKIITDAPNVMWAIDATQITTVEDGKVWLFGVAEHWNAELVGWHVTKHGTRHQALLSDDFQNQVKAWGMTPSYAFVGQPETNGVIERLFRTLKEQVVYGRIFQTIEEVRDTIRTFVARYNADWLIEKNGLASPAAARERWMAAKLRLAA